MVEEVGPDVDGVLPGDRVVVVAFNIVCGRCWFCRRGQTSLCENFRNLGAGTSAATSSLPGTTVRRSPEAPRRFGER